MAIEARDACQRTPLLIALMLNISVPDIIQCLLEDGADASVEDKQKCTPLEDAPFAANCGFKTDLYTNTWTLTTSLLYTNSKETCRLLVSAGYNLKQDPILPRVLYSDADEIMNR